MACHLSSPLILVVFFVTFSLFSSLTSTAQHRLSLFILYLLVFLLFLSYNFFFFSRMLYHRNALSSPLSLHYTISKVKAFPHDIWNNPIDITRFPPLPARNLPKPSSKRGTYFRSLHRMYHESLALIMDIPLVVPASPLVTRTSAQL